MDANNPYSQPEAELTNSERRPSAGQVGWRIFFFLMLPLVMNTLYSNLYDNSFPILYRVFSTFLELIFMLGIFGLAFSRRIGSAPLWFAVLAVSLFDNIAIASLEWTDGGYFEENLFATLLRSPVIYFSALGLFRYAQWLKGAGQFGLR